MYREKFNTLKEQLAGTPVQAPRTQSQMRQAMLEARAKAIASGETVKA
jgi:hypothetical protein